MGPGSSGRHRSSCRARRIDRVPSGWRGPTAARVAASTCEKGVRRAKLDAVAVQLVRAAVVLRDATLEEGSRIIPMQPRVPDTHRQIVGVPAPETARTRGSHLTPVVEVVLLEHAHRTCWHGCRCGSRAQILGHIPADQYEVPELGPDRATRPDQREPKGPSLARSSGCQAPPARIKRAEPCP